MLELLYAVALCLLAIYGINNLLFALIYWFRLRRSDPPPRPLAGGDVPLVTVQLPVFNERYVVERLLAAISALDYPRERLQVQVLDDSTDETRLIVDQQVALLRARGVWIEVCRRQRPRGYKGGALADATPRASGEYIAVFDADFLPAPDFLRNTLAPFADARVGCVQARWDHLNADYSLLTRIQAAGIDGHFLIEQEVRHRMGWFMAFNGSAGVWRRACIESAGGWQGDTLTEDLDLSIRAQLKGWRFVFMGDVLVPAEVPAQMEAYKRQQFRWAKGSVQTIKKLLPVLLRARLPWMTRAQAILQLGGYLTHLLMVLTFLLTLPVSLAQSPVMGLLQFLIGALLGPVALHSTAHMIRLRQRGRWTPFPRNLPAALAACLESLGVVVMLVVLGTGMSLNNSRATLEALCGVDSAFKRTPKFDLRTRADQWWQKRYSLPRDPILLAELSAAVSAIAIYVVSSAETAGHVSQWLLVYAVGYAYVAGVSLWQSAGRVFGRPRKR